MYKKPGKMHTLRTICLLFAILSTLLFGGCASTLHFLFDVDPDLKYNNEEKKWEQRK